MRLGNATPSLRYDKLNSHPRSSVGICVTGEARSFAHSGVRGSLRLLLDELPAPVLRISISRATAHRVGYRWRAGQASSQMTLDHAQLAREFPEAHIELLASSDCTLAHVRESTCCQRANGSQTVQAFMQYQAITRCSRQLLSAPFGRALSHIVRTRADAVYPEPGLLARAIVLAEQPIMAAKDDLKRARLPSDWFMVAPVRVAADFFGTFGDPIEARCSKDMRFANQPQPEMTWHLCAIGHFNCGFRASYKVLALPVYLIDTRGGHRCSNSIHRNMTRCKLMSAAALRTGKQRWDANPRLAETGEGIGRSVFNFTGIGPGP